MANQPEVMNQESQLTDAILKASKAVCSSVGGVVNNNRRLNAVIREEGIV
jgi:hypothetical protein